MRIIIVLAVVLSVALALPADSGADANEETSLLARGQRLLREGNWFRAAKVFEEGAGRFPHSTYLNQFIFCRAKANYHAGQLSDAIAGFSYFLSRFPSSAEAAHARFFLGNAHYRQGNVDKAVDNYLRSYRLSNDRQLDDLVAASLTAAFENASSVDINSADLEMLPPEKRCLLTRSLAKVIADHGDIDRAQKLLATCDTGSDRLQVADDRDRRDQNQIEIVVVLPLSGELHPFGQDIYDGAVVAAEQHRSHSTVGIRLTPYDSEGDPIKAARIIGSLSENQTDAVIGPLTSEAAAVASASLSCRSLPLLVPAATQAGLTLLSESSFQLAPNIELEGVKMAEYAIDSLQADSAVVITSTESEHLQMARAFADRFEKLGGRVIAVEYYRPRDNDFGRQIRDIKTILLGRQPGDSTFFLDENGDTLDPDGIEAHVDCLYLPGKPDQIRKLLPQINFYNLSGDFLGSDGWNDDLVLKLGDNVTRGAVFPTPFITGAGSEEYVRFAAAYDTRFGRRPNRLAALGYDAVMLAVTAVRSGGGSDQATVEHLRNVQGYDGASGKISFGYNRENIEMPLYRISAEEAVPTQSVTSTVVEDENP
ncbi:MAG: penicillin-binding protein activator [bacterium]